MKREKISIQGFNSTKNIFIGLGCWLIILGPGFQVQKACAAAIPVYFSEVAQESGVGADTVQYGHGATFVDLNNDGWLDILEARKETRNYMYISNGSGLDGKVTFDEVGDQAGINVPGEPCPRDPVCAPYDICQPPNPRPCEQNKGIRSITAADYDNDGDIDLFMAAGGSVREDYFYRNIGFVSRAGVGKPPVPIYEEIASWAGVQNQGNGNIGVWGDYNQDGYLDLFVANWESAINNSSNSHALYRNNGNGRFTDVTALPIDEGGAGLVNDDYPDLSDDQESGNNQIGIFFDYNNDGFLDIFETRATQQDGRSFPPKLWKNNGDGTYNNIADEPDSGILQDTHGEKQQLGAVALDYDNDGWMDIFVINYNATGDYGNNHNLLYRNNQGTGKFTEVASFAGVAVTGRAADAAAADFNNDGWMDIFVGTYDYPYNPSRIFFNNGNGKFSEHSNVLGNSGYHRAAATSMGDYNNDGFVDMYTVNSYSLNRLYRNQGNSNNWLQLDLRTTSANRSAIGARVRVIAGGMTRTQMVNGGRGLNAQDSPVLTFGLGNLTKADSVEIHWPSGAQEVLYDVEAKQKLVLHEGDIGDGGNIAPVAKISASPQQGQPALQVSFGSGNSYDPDGTIVQYQWNFGDGQTSTLLNPQHTYVNAGEYNATLTVTDNGDPARSGTSSTVIKVVSATEDLLVAYGLDEGTGPSTADASGNNNSGSVISGTWAQTGKFGKALSFNGTSSRVRAQNNITLGSAFTMMAWVNNPAFSQFETIVTVGNNRDFYLSNGRLAFWPGDGTERIFGNPIASGQWVHVAMVYESGSLRAYVNGAAQGNPASVNLGTFSGGVQVGAWITDGGGNGDYFSGMIDEVRVYTRALSQTEIQADMNTPINGAGPGDTTPPVISNVTHTNATSNSVSILWNTDEPADSQVEYGLTTGYGSSSPLDTALVTSHVVHLSGLSASTTYHYRVKSKDAAGNLRTSGDNTFMTTGAVGSAPLYGVFEKTLTASSTYSYTNAPELTVIVTGIEGEAIGSEYNIKGFWDGGSTFRFRFSPRKMGTWVWNTICPSDSGLNSKNGTFTVTGRLPTTDVSYHGHVSSFPGKPYQFQHQDGTPFFFFGDTQWVLFSKYIDNAEFQTYINARQSQGFNYIHSQVFPINPADSNQNPNGIEIFTNNNPDQLNPRYFDVMDQRVAYMNGHGIVAGLVFAWGNEGWAQFLNQTQVNKFTQYMINRYGAMNIVWVLAGEYEEGNIPGGWNGLGNYIDSNDVMHHLITAHTVDTSADSFGSQAWHKLIYQQTSEIGWITSDRIYNKPVVNSEFLYERATPRPDGFPTITADEVRRRAWEIVMRGGWFVYGNDYTFHSDAVMSQANLQSPGAGYVVKLKKFFTNNGYRDVQWADFTRFQVISSGRFLSGKPGAQYVYYTKTSGTQNLNLSDAAGTFATRCYDTTNGTWTGNEFNVTASGSVAINADRDEVACLLTKTAGGPNSPPGKPVLTYLGKATTGLSNLLPQNYQFAQLNVGSPYYVDRSFTLTSIPASLSGSTWVKTANDDKGNTSANLVSFTTASPVNVYVNFDARVITAPSWLRAAGWVKTGETVMTSDVVFNVYRKSFPAGQVVLGGNHAPGSQWPAGESGSNYFVAVKGE